MKTIKFYQTGGPEVLQLENVEVPLPGKNEIIVRQKAIGLNFIDTYYRSGLYQTPLPSGLGFEGAGIVESIGDEVTYFKVGDRVAYPHSKIGAYAECAVVLSHGAVKLPESISFEEGAAMMLKGLTAQYLLRQVHQVKNGETILFHAAAGGVGLIACQWAKSLGAKLIGTVSSEDKASVAKENGAWEIINYSKEDVAKRVLEITNGKKVPVVYDGVGKSTWESSLDCLSPRGLMVSFGNASGPVTGVGLSILGQKGSLYVTRPILGHFIETHEKLIAASNELFELVAKREIKIKIAQKYSLEDVKQAHIDLESRKTLGSTILIP